MALDAIIVGGSFSGMSAALQLARARRQIAVVDAGLRRNRFASTSHGFLAQDGRPPAAIVADARAQLLAYPNLRWLEGTATSAARRDGGFEVTLDGETLSSKRLVLATGVVDDLPPIEGVRERWGTSVFPCPYCHGFEMNGGRIGALASGPLSMHQAMLLPDWGRVTLFLNDAFEPDAMQYSMLAERNVTVERVGVARLVDAAAVELKDGRRLVFDGLFTMSATRMASPLAEQLGCVFEQGPIGPFIRRSESLETTVSGVFACGDAACRAGNIALAVSDGAMAGVFAHQSMVFGR